MARTIPWIVLAAFALGACATAPSNPKSPEERVVKAQQKIHDIHRYGEGESTYAAHWKAKKELEAALRALEEAREREESERPAATAPESACADASPSRS